MEEFDEFLKGVAKDAIANMDDIGEDTTAAAKLIQRADVAIGVWPDLVKPSGIGWHVIKGRHHLANGVPSLALLEVSGIPCRSREEAVAAEQAFGDNTLG
jgi:hypothetical protein